MTDWVVNNFDPPVAGLIVLIIAANLLAFRAMVRSLLQHAVVEPIVAPLIVGHIATLLANFALGLALNVGRWAPLSWSMHLKDFIIWSYTASLCFGLLEAVTYATWLRGWFGPSTAINGVVRYLVGE